MGKHGRSNLCAASLCWTEDSAAAHPQVRFARCATPAGERSDCTGRESTGEQPGCGQEPRCRARRLRLRRGRRIFVDDVPANGLVPLRAHVSFRFFRCFVEAERLLRQCVRPGGRHKRRYRHGRREFSAANNFRDQRHLHRGIPAGREKFNVKTQSLTEWILDIVRTR